MENENITQGIDNQENLNQNNIPNIENFLQKISDENLKNQINDTLISHNVTNDFEAYLNDISLAQKIQLKNKLTQCDSMDDIYNIIIVCLYGETGYQVGYHDIKNDTLILEETETEHQKAKTEHQKAETEHQETKTEHQETKTEHQETKFNNQKINENKQETFESVSGQKELNDAITARQDLIKDHPELATQTDKDSELYQATKSEFEQSGIIQQLKDSNHDDNFIDNYILVHTTLKEVKSNENYKDVNISFLEKAVKNLDNACNISDTKFDNFSSKNITQTRTELFDADIGNHSLKEAKKINKKSATHQKIYNEIFALDENSDRNSELIERYGKFIENDELKDLTKRYKSNELSEQDRDTLRKGLESIKENIDNQTKDLIEEMCIIAPIQGIFACIGPNLGNNFNLNKSREISNENGEVTITGHIDGIEFSLHHDTNNPDAHLQTSSALTKIDNNKFEIGERFENSPYKLPTNGDIFAIATSCITDENVTNTDDGPTYFQTLQNNICKKFNEILYKNAKNSNNYIKDKIKGEKISNQYLNLLGKIKGSPINGDIEQSNNTLYNFIDLINSTNYISNISDKENISQCLETIQNIISTHGKNDKQTTKYPKIISHFLMKKKILRRTKKILNGYDISGESIFDLFGYYTEQNSGIKTINFKQLKKDLEGKEGQESLIASSRQDNKNKENADIELDNAIENIV